MITRRDKLLNLPWEQKRYENHIRKVQSALPVVDNRPPRSREHVAIKLKRKQSEEERCTKIEKDNLMLLQKLGCIMRTSRVDNNWPLPQPTFLSRIAMYASTNNNGKIEIQTESSNSSTPNTKRIRKSKCCACTPQKLIEPTFPEKRIPWSPEKPRLGRYRSKSVPASKIALPSVPEVLSSTVPTTPENTKQNPYEGDKRRSKEHKSEHIINKSSESIILSTGSLVLAINFPPNSFIKLKGGCSEKLLKRGLCQCKSNVQTVF